ncbi:ABC transporter substrate-binding protein [Lewinella sp. 4G2]|uniref:ABC transporter substrate-binding protein n=1 Tax=Lewinella sp. 4G2 TaxID=1803372 RepID=UPI0012F955A2|nr:ABC transporter substrate-binding protein [Lewinella sp. 4G2]
MITKNSLFSLLALFLISFASCDALKPAVNPNQDDRRVEDRRNGNDDDLDPIQSRRVYDPETGTYIYVQNAPTDRMDTIEWTTTPESQMPPIVEDEQSTYVPPNNVDNIITRPATQIGSGNNGSRKLSSYNVEVSLPFLTDRYYGSEDKVSENSLWSLHFYSGARMALDEMRSSGGLNGNFNVHVSDTYGTSARTQTLTNDAYVSSAQMIIGPYVKDNVSLMAEAVRNRETVLVSPYSAGTGVSAQNPNYVQVNPTLNTHLRNILEHAMTKQNADRIILVSSGSSADQQSLKTLQEDYKMLANNAAAEPLEEIVVDINANPDLTFDEYLTGRKTVFIVPVYRDESFVANFLRRLYTDTREDFGRNVAVYGLPQWMNFTRINFDYYEGTNVHVSSSVFVDKLDPAVRDFRRAFYDRFATIPRDEAYVGYDVTRYFLGMLAKSGTRFQYDLPMNPETLLHTKFKFEPVVEAGADGMAVEGGPIDRFENKHVNILRFRDYTFRRVN